MLVQTIVDFFLLIYVCVQSGEIIELITIHPKLSDVISIKTSTPATISTGNVTHRVFNFYVIRSYILM